MEVGPIRLERRRLIAPYTVKRQGEAETFDLIYRFEEDVFDPDEPASRNLASMMAAQVAVNYGLFCREIVFRGVYDDADRRFLQETARHTAREIFVKKFLEPNPFLCGPAAQLSPLKLTHYLRARLVFPDEPLPRSECSLNHWKGDRSRHAILSSGGKESLLSFGLLREMGYETHPIFINESGRHWYTALNAYRFFAATYSETARVWTNSDRLFAWMLRQFPFIRQDFARVRSDEYPIRLWTVAVFLFGALPLLRKREIGRLVIGDEFDTTIRRSYRGIIHYDGLYDQSRYFDEALTRYYRRKGWPISQFSLLRPLSELLVEKILVERYPELQRHQLSCHAAHIEGARVRPCGRCEKCRRIVGMLVALGADPTRCGYAPQHVTPCLEALAAKGVHQETPGAEHLAFLLHQKGLWPDSSFTLKPRPHPEVMKIRLDPEKSPMESVPVDLRERLYRIFLEHADGAAKRIGRIWVDVDVLADPARTRPYPFESPEGENASRGATSLWGELTWPEARARLHHVDIALLPVGAIEQHGPHLPLDTDAFDAEYLAQQVATACRPPRPLVLPLISYGVSYHHQDFWGTLSVSPETLARLVYEVGMSAAHNGITKLVIINGHGGNAPALHLAAQRINCDAHIFVCVDTGETSEVDLEHVIETPNDVHAGEVETSTALATRPDLVRLDQVQKCIPRFSSRYLNFASRRSLHWYTQTAKISPSGVLGDPTKASRKKGEHIWAVMIKRLVEFVEDLKGMSLDEIYQKHH
ncbi:MAG: creatininase family protein [Acidobacteria bacterium]|nr:MAG: creatininase family protein [Acidobacteriota bacterium]